MFEEFSRGYYLGRLYVQPYDGEHAAIHEAQHRQVNEQVYADGEGIERLDAPLVMKLDEAHFPVRGAADVPADTLALPEALLDGTRIDRLPALKEVFLAKAERAAQLMRWYGHGLDAEPEGDPLQ